MAKVKVSKTSVYKKLFKICKIQETRQHGKQLCSNGGFAQFIKSCSPKGSKILCGSVVLLGEAKDMGKNGVLKLHSMTPELKEGRDFLMNSQMMFS